MGRQVGVDTHEEGLGFALHAVDHLANRPVHQRLRGQEQQVAHPLPGELGHQWRKLGTDALQRRDICEKREEDRRTHGGG
jgi:hypothetical protein